MVAIFFCSLRCRVSIELRVATIRFVAIVFNIELMVAIFLFVAIFFVHCDVLSK